MLCNIVQRLTGKDTGRHILVLDALIAENGGGQVMVQIHLPQIGNLPDGQLLAALPECLQFAVRQLL